MRSVKLKNQTCRVQTLMEWLDERIDSLEKDTVGYCDICKEIDTCTNKGRLAELRIIREKMDNKVIDRLK